ncbi:MAG: NAD(P)H-dependent glycerol-3-phosphate dehydrogenase [Salaquimonas sp.]
MSSQKTITVMGAGAWGTALASVLTRKGHQTFLCGRDASALETIGETHENTRYLPGIKLPRALKIRTDTEAAIADSDVILLVTPAQTIHSVIETYFRSIKAGVPVILCAKGINRETGQLPAETAADLLTNNPVAALSGPSFASDVASDLPTAVTLACNDNALTLPLAEAISGPTFRVYTSDDLKGVELGGALKNVIALAVGVCRGLGLGASAEAALIARGFAELNRLAIALGAKPQTLMGLSGLGDLVLTCSSPQSRNFAFGMALGAGTDTRNMLLAEGALTAPIAAKIATKNSIDCPIIQAVVKLLAGDISAIEASHVLLSRPLKTESE